MRVCAGARKVERDLDEGRERRWMQIEKEARKRDERESERIGDGRAWKRKEI